MEKDIDFKKVLSSMVGGLYIYDLDKQAYVLINDAYTRITGWTMQELNSMGESFLELFHESERDSLLEHMGKIAASEKDESVTFEYRFKKKDGGWVWLLSQDTPFERDKDGKVTKFIGSFVDISDKKEFESQLKESEERFKNIFKTSPVGIAVVSPDGQWIEVNESIPKMLGYSGDELLRLTFQDITHEDDLEKDLALIKKTLNGEIDSYNMKKRYIHKSGSVVYALLVVAIVRDENSKPKYFISQIIDLTDDEKKEKKLKEKMVELEKLNSFMVGRENRMEELKKELRFLKRENPKE